MNKEFISKMMKAKKMEYEAFRALLPDKINDNIEEMGDFLKESLVECIKEFYFSNGRDKEAAEKGAREEEKYSREESGREKIRKVTIE